jgi:hypothetical protein
MRSHQAPRHCPVCGDELTLTRLGCPSCGTELSGSFQACDFCALSPDERDLLRVFLVSRGNMKELERHLGVSYPTARARFDSLLAHMGLAAGPGGAAPPGPAPGPGDGRLAVLQRLACGEMGVGQAEELIEEMEEG